MSEYKKGKYSFSLAPVSVIVGTEVIEERKNQIEELIRDLEEYDIILKDLAEDEVSYDLRNEILNIAMYISKDEKIYNELCEKKDISLSKLSKIVLKSRRFLQKWREYIIVYTLILGNSNYKYISDYLKIVEKKEDVKKNTDNNVISFKNIIKLNSNDKDEEKDQEKNEEKEEENNESLNDEIEEPLFLKKETEKSKGIVLYKRKKKAIILTSGGEFIKTNIDDENIGFEANINIKKENKNKNIYIFAGILFMICVLSIGAYKYFKGVTTIIFEVNEQIVLEVNSFNRVVRSKSNLSNDESILKEVDVQDRDLDTAIYKLIKYCNEEKKIIKGQVAITVTGSAIKHGFLADTSEYVSKEGINVKFNNAGYESNLR